MYMSSIFARVAAGFVVRLVPAILAGCAIAYGYHKVSGIFAAGRSAMGVL